jgi:hypothetical protein
VSDELKLRCGNCGEPYRSHRQRMTAPPICADHKVYRPGTEEELDAFYRTAFPEGPQPIATLRADDPEAMAKLRAALSPEALAQHFGQGGGGIAAITAILSGSEGRP